MRLINVAELSEKIRLAPQTIRNRLTNSPESLPPRRHLPNCNTVLFADIDVDAWIAALPKVHGNTEIPTDPKKKKRGRPTKAEVIARETALGGAQ